MGMTTKLLSFLTILFVFFKLGEPANVMMSISGDENFLFQQETVAEGAVVGFVYDNANGGVALPTCTQETKSELLTLKTDCAVVAAAAATAAKATATGTRKAVDMFTTIGKTINMMVAEAAVPPIATASTADITAQSAIVKITSTGSNAAVNTYCFFLCDNSDEATTTVLFSADETTSDIGNVKLVTSSVYSPVMKCVGLIQTAESTPIGLGTFVVISSQHTDITTYFHLFTLPFAVVLHQSIDQTTNASTTVGYISGKEACPTGNANLTFTPTTGSCKGKVTTTAALTNYPFITFAYTRSKYYLNVTGVNTTSVTCTTTVTTTTSTDGFTFNFKYSKILIGMLLIFMLKMINGY